MEWKKAKCFSFESFFKHWLWACRWSSNEQAKWKKKTKKMIFVGYDQKSKRYKFYNPNEEKIVINRDVEFN
jgi:hypothetical protein